MTRNCPSDRPRIGIPTYGQNEENRFTLPRAYVDSVRRAGGIPFLIPPGDSDPRAYLSFIDGLVLTGGGDIDPRHYGGKSHESIYLIDAERDTAEFDFIRRAIDLRMPTLCICRGAQVLNVALGGTLHEHLPDVVNEEILHRAPPMEPTPHDVKIESGCRLAKILGESEFSVASWHHQAVRRTAPGLEVVGHAPDGVIEAVEMPDHPWLHGVQWHPELTADRDPVQQRLFDALIKATQETRK